MSNPQHEPTMEEILASIRKIISEDTPESTPQAPDMVAPPPEMPAHDTTHDMDVLELTQEVESAPAPEPVYAAPPPPEDEVVFAAIEEPKPAAPVAHEGIFSDHTRTAMDNAFAGIPDEEEPAPVIRHTAAPIAPVDGSSVETVFERAVRESFEPVLNKYLSDNSAAVIERMKPLIREWMDEHFPALLEGAVRAEVERVVKARGAKR